MPFLHLSFLVKVLGDALPTSFIFGKALGDALPTSFIFGKGGYSKRYKSLIGFKVLLLIT